MWIPGYFLAFDGVSLEIEIPVFFGKKTQTPFWDVLHTQFPVGAVVVSRDPKRNLHHFWRVDRSTLMILRVDF